jgi:hypothetical protein
VGGANVKKMVALICSALVLCAAGTAQAQWDVFHNDTPRWKMEASVLALDRPGDDNGIPLITNSLTRETLFQSGQATDLNGTAGVDISVQFHPYGVVEMEIEGSFARWDTAHDFFGPNLSTPFLPDLSPDEINYRYDSDLFSIELNGRREIAPGLTFLLGPRFVYLAETVQTNTSTQIVPAPPLPVFDFETETIIDTKNPLVGAQLGAEWDFLLTRDIRIHSFIKAGGYANFSSATRRNTVTGFDPDLVESTKSAGSFVGETGGRIYFDIYPRACSLYLGYEATWIDNVALAPVQFVTVNNPNSDVILGVTPFIQGGVFGLEFVY